jgi:Zn-dependent metalloprotease
MKTNYLLLVAFLLSLNMGAQNKLIENAAHQKSLSFNPVTSPEKAIQTFKRAYKLGENTTFESFRTSVDRNGVEHTRYQQFYNGVKVEFGMLIVHSKNGNVTQVNGELYDTKDVNLVASLSKEAAFSHAKNYIHADKYLWESPSEAKIMAYTKPSGELVVFPDVNTGKVHLAYMYDIYATAPIKRNEVYVDAHTGHILYENPIIKHANRLISDKEVKQYATKLEETMTFAAGTAATRYSGSRPIETTFSGGSYVLSDTSRGNGINTYNCQTTTNYQNVDFTDNDNNWTTGEHNNAAKDNGALDAHWGAEMTYDFWMNTFNRDSFDGNGGAINSYVHYDTNYDNAFWNGSVMTYGDGNSFDILTAIDVCGHEIGHAVCTYTANLAYQNQSGGMNEGFSDIWGACIEHYGRTGALSGATTSDVWLIGEDLFFVPLRSMSDPLSRGNPDTYLGNNWTTTGDEGSCVPTGGSTGNDYCGVHNNSGVLNHWFYILTEGKSGTNNAPAPDTYNVTGIGMEKAAEIAYLTERDYLTANSTYLDARNGSIAVALSLYCANSAEVTAVTNAWYAVNVGDAFTGVPVDVGVRDLPENLSIACGTSYSQDITIVNGGATTLITADVSYSIDGGANSNETWTGSLNVCEEDLYSLTIPALTRGSHTLTVTVTTTNDGIAVNNTSSSTINVNDAGTEEVVNGFETSSDALIAYDSGATTSMWERGTAAGTTLSNAVAGSSQVYGTNLDGIHGDDTTAYLISQCYDLSTLMNTSIEFDMAFDIEQNYDVLYVEYTINGGTSWSTLGSATANWYNSSQVYGSGNADCQTCIGAQWTGSVPSMNNYSYPLSAFDSTGSAESNIIFRFVYRSDAGYADEGAIIDNFVIRGEENVALSVDQNEFENLTVYPNPTNGSVSIMSNSDLSKAKVSIIDIRGRVIATDAATFDSDRLLVNMNSLANGSYFIKIEDVKNISVKQVVKN